MRHDSKQNLTAETSLVSRTGLPANFMFNNTYCFECVGADGEVKWTEEVNNLVTNEGLDDILNKYFADATTNYNPGWYCGLLNTSGGTNNPAAGDTLASKAWTEVNDYTVSPQTAGQRGEIAFGSAASGQQITSTAVAFGINGPMTVDGAFVTTQITANAAVLYGVATFASARDVVAGDTLNVTIVISASSGA